MAQQDYSGIITIAVIAGAAWYAYEQGWFSGLFGTTTTTGAGNAPSTAVNCPSPNTLIAGVCTAPISCPSPNTVINGVCTAPVTNTSTPATPVIAPKPLPTTAYSGADQPWVLQMAQLASVNSLDIDQWNYYFNQLAGSTWAGTLTPISGTQEGAMLATLASYGQTESYPMTLPQWYWLVTTGGGGLSGLGRFGDYLGIPGGAIHGGW